MLVHLRAPRCRRQARPSPTAMRLLAWTMSRLAPMESGATRRPRRARLSDGAGGRLPGPPAGHGPPLVTCRVVLPRLAADGAQGMSSRGPDPVGAEPRRHRGYHQSARTSVAHFALRNAIPPPGFSHHGPRSISSRTAPLIGRRSAAAPDADVARVVGRSGGLSRGHGASVYPADSPLNPRSSLSRSPTPLEVAALDAPRHGVVTTCAVAIAETGTIVLDGGGGQGRRSSTSAPDYHLAVAAAARQIVATCARRGSRARPAAPSRSAGPVPPATSSSSGRGRARSPDPRCRHRHHGSGP